jgi:DNA-binding response OmpR family regulator
MSRKELQTSIVGVLRPHVGAAAEGIAAATFAELDQHVEWLNHPQLMRAQFLLMLAKRLPASVSFSRVRIDVMYAMRHFSYVSLAWQARSAPAVEDIKSPDLIEASVAPTASAASLVPDASLASIASVKSTVKSIQPAKPRARVLVVDDSEVALQFIESRLRSFGINVDVAASGEAALVQASQSEYALVFLDVVMTGLDGYQTCKAIKKHKNDDGRSPIVVMLTSRGGTVDKVRGTFAGCDAYLTKPLDSTRLIQVLAKYSRELAIQIDARSKLAGAHAFVTGTVPANPKVNTHTSATATNANTNTNTNANRDLGNETIAASRTDIADQHIPDMRQIRTFAPR